MELTPSLRRDLTLLFGLLGNIVAFGVFLSPLPTFWRIFKKKSTEGFQSIPYSVALFSAMLLLYYAFIKEYNGTMIITINAIGVAIEGFYLTIYLIYAPRHAKIYTAKLLGLFNFGFLGLIVATTMWFAKGADGHRLSRGGMRETIIGWICAVFSVCVFAAPLSVMRMVIRTKSVEYMPFWLSFTLTLCAVMWFFYGLLIKDFYIALPNILGFAFGITQMILYLIYKDSTKKYCLGIKDTEIKLAKIEKINKSDSDEEEVIEVITEDIVAEKGKNIVSDTNTSVPSTSKSTNQIDENGKIKLLGKGKTKAKGKKSIGTSSNTSKKLKNVMEDNNV